MLLLDGNLAETAAYSAAVLLRTKWCPALTARIERLVRPPGAKLIAGGDDPSYKGRCRPNRRLRPSLSTNEPIVALPIFQRKAVVELVHGGPAPVPGCGFTIAVIVATPADDDLAWLRPLASPEREQPLRSDQGAAGPILSMLKSAGMACDGIMSAGGDSTIGL